MIRKIILTVFTFFALALSLNFYSCKDDSNPSAPPDPVVSDLIRLDSNFVEGARAIMSIYALDSMHTGYNPVYIILYDSLTKAVITDAHITFTPMNHGHAAPYENPPGIAVDGKFKGALVLTQAFTDASLHWHIHIHVHNHEAPGQPEGEYDFAPGRVRDNTDGFKSIVMPDSTALFLSYIAPLTPVTGLNTIEFIINKNEPELYPPDGSYSIQMTPEFLSSGQTTSNNINPVGNTSTGHYTGTMNLTQSGAWRIKLRLTKNSQFYDTYFDISY